jgi:hypothetical protein
VKNSSKNEVNKVNQKDFTFDYIQNIDFAILKKIFDKFGILIIKNIISKDITEELLE